MKKKLILGCLTILTALISLNSAKADTEGVNDGECKAPYSNTCLIVHGPLGITKTIKGVLTINV